MKCCALCGAPWHKENFDTRAVFRSWSHNEWEEAKLLLGDEKADRGLVAVIPSLKREGVTEPDSSHNFSLSELCEILKPTASKSPGYPRDCPAWVSNQTLTVCSTSASPQEKAKPLKTVFKTVSRSTEFEAPA